MSSTLQRKVDYSIALLRKAEPLALKMHPDGFHLAFSGGKDSQVLYHIAKMAGVKFKAHMQITTLDPPELMQFIRKNYPDVQLHRPEINFYKLIEKKKMLPLRQSRYCCAYLKEQAGAGTVTLLGVRKEESAKRAARSEVERIHSNPEKRAVNLDQFNVNSEQEHSCIGGEDKIVVSPIFKWSKADVWNLIRGNGIEYCKLYDEGFHRIGCLFCPMASKRERARARKRYPGFERLIKRSIQKLIDEHGYFNNYEATADEIFNWWLSDRNPDEYFAMLRQQTKLNL